MFGAYTMVHYADLNVGSELKRVLNANNFIYVANHIYLCYKPIYIAGHTNEPI